MIQNGRVILKSGEEQLGSHSWIDQSQEQMADSVPLLYPTFGSPEETVWKPGRDSLEGLKD